MASDNSEDSTTEESPLLNPLFKEFKPMSEEVFTGKIVQMLENHEDITIEQVWKVVIYLKLNKDKVVKEFVREGILEPKEKEPVIDEGEFLRQLYED